MIRFILNQKEITTDQAPGYLLLDLIRYQQNLTGTKIGCREGDCGACTVLVGEFKNEELIYHSVTSCLMPIGNANGKHIVTIEGVNIVGLNFIQQAFADEAATQCGFCTPGFIVSLAGFCLNEKTSGCQSAIDSVNGNICRCTGYKSIEKAAVKVADKMDARNNIDAVRYAVDNNILPTYFTEIKNRLKELNFKTNGQLIVDGHEIKFLAGGTDLYVQQHETMVHTNVDLLFDREELNGISQTENKCYLGASVTVADLMDSAIMQKHFPELNKFMKLVSSTQIRNMATIAGNFINASPIGDMTIFFLALDAKLILSDGYNKREIALRDLYKGYKILDKKGNEFVEKFYFELPEANSLFNFEKVSKRTHLDIASVNSAMAISIDDEFISSAGISAGGVGPIPFYLKRSSAFLTGKIISEETVSALLEIVQSEISPISDTRGSETYKRLLLNQLIKAHFIKLFPKLSVENILSV